MFLMTTDCAADRTSAARHEEAMAQRQVQRHAKSHLEAERAIKWREERVSGVIVIVIVSVIVGIGLPSDCHLIYI
jgi:hypothetical protein